MKTTMKALLMMSALLISGFAQVTASTDERKTEIFRRQNFDNIRNLLKFQVKEGPSLSESKEALSALRRISPGLFTIDEYKELAALANESYKYEVLREIQTASPSLDKSIEMKLAENWPWVVAGAAGSIILAPALFTTLAITGVLSAGVASLAALFGTFFAGTGTIIIGTFTGMELMSETLDEVQEHISVLNSIIDILEKQVISTQKS